MAPGAWLSIINFVECRCTDPRFLRHIWLNADIPGDIWDSVRTADLDFRKWSWLRRRSPGQNEIRGVPPSSVKSMVSMPAQPTFSTAALSFSGRMIGMVAPPPAENGTHSLSISSPSAVNVGALFIIQRRRFFSAIDGDIGGRSSTCSMVLPEALRRVTGKARN